MDTLISSSQGPCVFKRDILEKLGFVGVLASGLGLNSSLEPLCRCLNPNQDGTHSLKAQHNKPDCRKADTKPKSLKS